jgi:hypothetical protein
VIEHGRFAYAFGVVAKTIDPAPEFCVVVFRHDGTVDEVVGPMGQQSAAAMVGDVNAVTEVSGMMPYKMPAVAIRMSRRYREL